MIPEQKKKIICWIMLLFVTLIYYFANMQKVLVPGATFDEIQQAFNIDASAVTRLGAVFLYIYAAGQLVAGLLADRYSGTRVIVIGGAVFCIGSLISAYTGNYYVLCFSRFLTGLGAAAIYLSMVKEIARVTGNSLPLWIGVATIIGYSGAITGATPFIAGVKYFSELSRHLEIGYNGYNIMMFAAGIVTVAVYAGFLATVSKMRLPPVCKEVKFDLASYGAFFKRRHNIFLGGAIGINFGTYFALQSIIGKKFLQDFCQMNSYAAGNVLTATMIIAAINGFILANISKVCGNRRRPFLHFSSFGCLTGALMIFAAVLFDIRHPALAITGMLLLAFAGNVSPIFVALVRETNEENRFGTVLSINNSFAYAVTAVFGGILGRLMDVYAPTVINDVSVYGRNSYLLVFGVLLILIVISVIFSLFLKESFGRNIADKVR